MNSITRISIALMCVMPLFVHAQEVSSNSFGANIHVMQRVPQEEWSSVLTSAHSVGVRFGREELSWNEIEPEEGVFEWSETDAAVAAYEAAGIEMTGLLTYSSSWAATTEGDTHSAPDLNAWSDYVAAVATRYAGRVAAWEIWNEPNHSSFFSGDSADYTALLQAASDAIRDADPDAKIVLGGLSGADTSFLREVLPHITADAIDAIGIHPYRVIGSTFTYAPEEMQDGLNTLATDIGNLVAELERDGFENMPLWFTEFGYPTHTAGLSEKQQVQYLARAYVIALSNVHVKKIFWYSLIDAGSDDTDQEDRFGLFAQDLTPKPAAYAVQFVRRHLKGATKKGVDTTQMSALSAPSSIEWNVDGAVCTTAHMTAEGESIRVTYAFMADSNCYVPIQAHLSLPHGTHTVFMQLAGSSDDTTLRVRLLDSSGETFQYTLSRMPEEPTWYRVNVDALANHWGGNDNGVVDGVLSLDSLVLDDADSLHEEGSVTLSAIGVSTALDQYGYRFSQGGKPLIAIWTTAEKYATSYTFAHTQKITRHRFQKSDRKTRTLVLSFTAGRMVQFIQVR